MGRLMSGGNLADLQLVAPLAVPRFASGSYYGPPGAYAETSRPDGYATVSRMLVPVCTFDRIAVHVTGAGTTGALLRLGVFADAAGKPGEVLIDAGTVAATSTGVKTITISLAISAPQPIWVGMAWQGAPSTVPTVRGIQFGVTQGNPMVTGDFAYGLGWTWTGQTGAFSASPSVLANDVAGRAALRVV